VKLRGGQLKKNIEIEAGKWNHIEIPVREGSTISILAQEVDNDDFSVYILRSSDVKRVPIVGSISEYNPENALWKKERVKNAKKDYTAKERDVLYVLFDNYHAKSKYKSIDIEVNVEHLPLEVGNAPLRESFEVDAGWLETIDVNVNAGDTIRAFGRVTKGNDITIHVISKLYETPDSIHLDKAYWTKEKVGEIEIEYQCTKTEPLLLVFDNGYSLRTTKTIDVSVQILKGSGSTSDTSVNRCRFCSATIEKGLAFCPHCGGKQ